MVRANTNQRMDVIVVPSDVCKDRFLFAKRTSEIRMQVGSDLLRQNRSSFRDRKNDVNVNLKIGVAHDALCVSVFSQTLAAEQRRSVAWGASPRSNASLKDIQPQRGDANSIRVPLRRRSAAKYSFSTRNLGLAPQATLRRRSAANNELRRRSAAGRDGQEVV